LPKTIKLQLPTPAAAIEAGFPAWFGQLTGFRCMARDLASAISLGFPPRRQGNRTNSGK
jgi:hypothetical protein